ncbi:MAG: hypothetical protein E6H09_23955 [Bacteroidetes bacterium]|nr:MAG: hypothetical protein E6H09_23955 [Bacteroidota bacterium]
MKGKTRIIFLNDDDKEIHYTMVNGGTRKEELYYGTSFLSQSSRFICMNPSIKNIEIINGKGERRIVQ